MYDFSDRIKNLNGTATRLHGIKRHRADKTYPRYGHLVENKFHQNDLYREPFLVAVALVVSLIESALPSFPLAPGAKLGLSNIAPLFALLMLGNTLKVP